MAPSDPSPAGDAPTDAQLQALGTGMAAQADQAAAGDEALRREDGVFRPAFDAVEAVESIAEKNREVVALREVWEDLKEQASDAKKRYDKAAKAMSDLIEELAEDAHEREQPFLAPVDDRAPERPKGCPIEASGQRCVICEEQRARSATPLVEAPAHPDHAEHEAVAAARTRELLSALLQEQRNTFIDSLELETLNVADVEALQAWAMNPGPIPPEALQVAHVAAEAGTLQQICSRCGSVLRNQADNAEENREWWYPVGAFVGIDCESSTGEAPAAAATEEPPAEEARPIAKRGRKRKGKVDPEAERQAQEAAGAEAAQADAISS